MYGYLSSVDMASAVAIFEQQTAHALLHCSLAAKPPLAAAAKPAATAAAKKGTARAAAAPAATASSAPKDEEEGTSSGTEATEGVGLMDRLAGARWSINLSMCFQLCAVATMHCCIFAKESTCHVSGMAR